MHIAGGVGVPVVALFGPTDSVATGPRGRAHGYILQEVPEGCVIPCFVDNCTTFNCMRNITVKTVMDLIEKHRLL